MSTLTDEDLAMVIRMGGGIKGKPLMPSNPQMKGADLNARRLHARRRHNKDSVRDTGATS